ncbi:enoyl-CoA hydratase/isomerase family protein [Litorisediminicola beolgyonensis]|uniref:3-hydroxyisobutyryl-CoA hydrolase n=1 Tax=Litorisediminicola beolgyonensis TaxID=1173614 RepID=A0ABW3ZJK3_9RHOB
MSDISIRTEGRAGRITLDRPKALNALTYEMCLAIEEALLGWLEDNTVSLVILDGAGDKAFCAGGDIAEMYATGTKGDYEYGRRFWRDEYRLNALIADYPKPVVSLLHGFTMGGGVGVGCHGSHRVVCESSQISMPECSIGLVPDVGGSYLLARAPGRLGEYLGLTAARMGPADAILAGFADVFVPRDRWDAVTAALIETGDTDALAAAAEAPPEGTLAVERPEIDALFGGETLRDVLNALKASDTEFARSAEKALSRNAPLSMAVALETIHRLRAGTPTIRKALDLEYRFTHRAMEHGDFLEGIRARIIDKDQSPSWRHAADKVPMTDTARLLQPVREASLAFHDLTQETPS